MNDILSTIDPRTPAGAIVGHGRWTYRATSCWCELPPGCEVSAVACGSAGNVFVFARTMSPVMMFDRDGNFLQSWGDGLFVGPHGITVGPDDSVYCTDYLNHTVRKFTSDGRLLFTLGVPGVRSDTGAQSVDFRDVRRAAGPFNHPTNLALSPDGGFYVADGYGNARIHRFDEAGQLLFSWGAPGRAPGEFHVPHGIAVDSGGLVYVADRENSRIQRFTAAGEFVDEWLDVARPCQVCVDSADHVYVAELGFRAGMFAGIQPPSPSATGGRLSVFSNRGELLARWGGGDRPCTVGDFFAPHDVSVDARGDIYVSEVCYTAGVNRGVIGPACHTLQKFVRLTAS